MKLPKKKKVNEIISPYETHGISTYTELNTYIHKI